MALDTHGSELVSAVALLGAAVVSVPIFKRIGLGSVVGYLAAGVAIGPFGLKLFRDPESVLGVAEFGVVMLLFVIGLELKPSRLWSLRRDIFGLGAAQVVGCGALLMAAGMMVGLSPAVAFVAASGLALSSTAIVMQILEERGETTTTHGQKTFAILLFQDLAIVPLLAVLAVLAPMHDDGGQSRFVQIAIAIAAIVGLVAVGRYLLNPLFQVLAAARAREIMTAAALLVVLGAALAMQASGLSMAMGAFLAGVLLSESSFRHQLEADVDPFRGLLLGLFFLAVGMSIDLSLIARDWPLVLAAVAVFVALKVGGIYAAGAAVPKQPRGFSPPRAAPRAGRRVRLRVVHDGAGPRPARRRHQRVADCRGDRLDGADPAGAHCAEAHPPAADGINGGRRNRRRADR